MFDYVVVELIPAAITQTSYIALVSGKELLDIQTTTERALTLSVDVT